MLEEQVMKEYQDQCLEKNLSIRDGHKSKFDSLHEYVRERSPEP